MPASVRCAIGALIFVLWTGSALPVSSPDDSAGPTETFDTPGEGETPAGWKRIRFRKIERETEFRLVETDGRTALEAYADRSSSGLVWECDFDPVAFSSLSWAWKTAGGIPGEDLSAKTGDDLAARVLVMFPYDPDRASAWTRTVYGVYHAVYGEYPPAQALSYVWSSKLRAGQIVESAYTSRLRHVVVAGVEAPASRWRMETRDIEEDFRHAFPGETLPRRARIGIMVDTDNTGAVTTSWFDDISLSPRGP